MPSVLIIFSGLPGTGKSSLAEAAGRALGWPVFTKDRLEAALWRSGISRDVGRGSGWAGYELLTTLAEQQLRLGQAAILDSVAGREVIRRQWRELGVRSGANFRVVECVASNEILHRARLADRQRGIPGWYELDWAEVERVRSEYEPWSDERLTVDMVRPFDDNLARVLAYLRLS
jgi:predicted kinase